MNDEVSRLFAVIPAAGLSRRMGQPENRRRRSAVPRANEEPRWLARGLPYAGKAHSLCKARAMSRSGTCTSSVTHMSSVLVMPSMCTRIGSRSYMRPDPTSVTDPALTVREREVAALLAQFGENLHWRGVVGVPSMNVATELAIGSLRSS